MRKLLKGNGQERGQALVEFALVATVFFILMFAIFDFTRLLQSWVAVQHSAREGARYAITGQDTCPGGSSRDACIEWTAKKSTVGLFGGGPSGADVTVSYKAWNFEGDDWNATGVDDATGKQCDQLEVTVSYHHSFVTPIIQAIAPSGLDVKGRQKMTNEPFGPCNDPSDGV